jgi:hypothetical protein
VSKHISDERLEILFRTVNGEFRRESKNDSRRLARGNSTGPIWVTVDARVLSPLLDEIRRRRSKGAHGAFPIGNTAKVLMAMKVGETIDYPPVTQGALYSARTTARKHLGIPDARWHAETQPDGLTKITRLPDGAAQIYGKPRNPAIKEIANMRVGETKVLTTLPRKIYHGIIVQARLMMDNAEAKWRFTNLANGHVKAERVR